MLDDMLMPPAVGPMSPGHPAARRERSPVLVTGGAGYIGSHVVLALRAAGWPVVVLDDLSCGVLLPLHRSVPFVRGDVGDRDLRATLARHRIGAVIHLAASTAAPESARSPFRYYRNNLAAAIALIETCAEHGVRVFVFSSTAAIHGNPTACPVDATAPLASIDPCGASKGMIEEVLADVARATPFPHLIRVACEAALGRRALVPIHSDD